jgi:CO/xanthine dehydrogenase FAD-binding subunit
MRMTRAERALVVGLDHKAGVTAAQATLDADLAPSSDNQASAETRLHLARVLLGRALAQFQDAVG